MSNNFVHCHCHTDHSLLDGCGRSIEYADMAADLGMSAIAITDHGQLYGLPAHVEACVNKGIKPLVGCEWYVNDNRFDIEGEKKARKEKTADFFDDPQYKNYHIVTIAINQVGWFNLLKLNHDAVRNGYYYRPRTDHNKLCECSEGLIATTACMGSSFNQAILRGDKKEAVRLLSQFKDAFGDRFYAEIHLNEIEDQNILNPALLKLCNELKIPFIVSDDVHYACMGEAGRQDESIACAYHKMIGDCFKLEARNLYFSSYEQVLAKNKLFKCDIPEPILKEGLRRTLEIADRCNVNIFPFEVESPKFVYDKKISTFEHLQNKVYDGLKKLIKSKIIPATGHQLIEYINRAKFELNVIKEKGLEDFYLVCWDAADYCDRNRIFQLVRGSGNSSLVACAIGLTRVDPIKWKLIFERFLDPERPEPPDFDIDVAASRRSEVKQYIINKYGGKNGERCMSVIAMQTTGIRSAIRNIGKVKRINNKIINRLCVCVDGYIKGMSGNWERILTSKIGDDRKKAVDELIDGINSVDTNGDVKNWIFNHRDILYEMLYHVGRSRNRSRHAAALALGSRALNELVPIDRVGSGDNIEIVTAWGEGQARQDLSKAGVMKLDLLGLSACDIVFNTVELIKENHNVDVWDQLNTLTMSENDPKMIAEFCTGAGYGLHEVNTGRERIAKFMGKLQPKNLSDVVALLALYRPGAMDFCDVYVDRMQGKSKVPKVHPIVDEELFDTYGIFVYQEQIMMIINRLAGISKRQAYKIIKAISKKQHKVISSARDQFIKGALTQGMDEDISAGIFDVIQKWAEYGFNRSHSTGYALLSGVTAWLRGHYPIEFYCTVLNQTKNEKPKRSGKVREIYDLLMYVKSRGIGILPLCIQKSAADYKIENNKIRLGLKIIPGIGDGVADKIYKSAPYKNFEDFLSKCNVNKVNVKVINGLIKSGSLDSLVGEDKRGMLYNIMQYWVKSKKNKNLTRLQVMKKLIIKDRANINDCELSDGRFAVDERDLLGFNLRYNPFKIKDRDVKIVRLYKDNYVSNFYDGNSGGVVGQILDVKIKKDKNDNTMADFSINTYEGDIIQVVVFSSIWEKDGFQDQIREGGVYIFRGKPQRKQGSLLLGMGIPKNYKSIYNIDHIKLI